MLVSLLQRIWRARKARLEMAKTIATLYTKEFDVDSGACFYRNKKSQ